jgi:hypothetical protein
MSDPVTRYPLAWPTGWVRTRPGARRRAPFGRTERRTGTHSDGAMWMRTSSRPLTVPDAISRLATEIGRLGATREILSTNVPVRLDGLPRSGQAEPADPGAAVYFQLEGQPRCLACDRWNRVADNIAAIAQHIDALRRINRYGVGTIAQVFAGYAALPPSAEDWWLVLGISPTASLEAIDAAFRVKARLYHPDVGGRHEDMARLNDARARAILARSSPAEA